MSTGKRVWLTAPKPPLDRLICRALLAQGVAGVVCVYSECDAPAAQGLAGVECVHADLSSHRRLRDLIWGRSLGDVDTIVHVPVASAEQGSGTSADLARHLVQLAEEQPRVRRFVLRSVGRVYRLDSREPVLIDEHHAVEWLRMPNAFELCAEADFTLSERIGSSRLQLVVLRCAEVLSAHLPGPLYGYLSSRVCLRPLGYDPMLNVLSLEDLARAIALAAVSDATGIFNIPGYDTLPLSELIHAARRIDVPLPGPALTPLYALRKLLREQRFHYPTDQTMFHYGAVLDGSKARRLLAYEPAHPVDFDHLFATAGAARAEACAHDSQQL